MRQLAGWIAWLRREPRGDRRDDSRAALMTAFVRSAMTGEREDPETFRLKYETADPSIADPEVAAMVDGFLQPQTLVGFSL